MYHFVCLPNIYISLFSNKKGIYKNIVLVSLIFYPVYKKLRRGTKMGITIVLVKGVRVSSHTVQPRALKLWRSILQVII